MCFFKNPKINTKPLEVTASQLVPETQAKAPEAVEAGGTTDEFNKKKGRKQLTIDKSAYNPVNY